MKTENRRVELKISKKLLEEIESYQYSEGITNRTTAIIELIRLGLHIKRGK